MARQATSIEAIRQAGIAGVTCWLREEELPFHVRTVEKIVAWAANAADADSLAVHVSRVWPTLHDDWRSKTEQIGRLEQKLAGILAQTP